MQSDNTVVPLARGAPGVSSASPFGRLPAKLVPVRDRALQLFRTALQSLFDNADDTLYQMADRAASSQEQNYFFEAMHAVRLKRKSIEGGFLQKINVAMLSLSQVHIDKAPNLENASFSNLSLMDADSLEQNVAVDTMVGKVAGSNSLALGHLTTRLNVLCSKKLDGTSNPLGPTLLCESFLAACADLGVEIRVKLIVLKLFEKYVLSQLGQIYAEANQLLVNAGVLPELHSAVPRRESARPAHPVSGGAAATPMSSAGPMAEATEAAAQGSIQLSFAGLQSMLAEARGGAPSRGQVAADALPISSNDLMRLLSHLQARLETQESAGAPRERLDALLHKASAKSGRERMLGRVDDDVINLVSMLFEFILDDRNLAAPLKALIARLQIPMLKAAVLDKSFFAHGSHPARRLLNEIASAALGWADGVDASRDNLYKKIEEVVQRLLNDFVDDPDIFSELLTDFTAFVGNERRRTELLEQRTRDAEEARVKIDMARQQVEQAINSRLFGKALPQVVVRLLQEAWSQVLLLTSLKRGADSPQWHAALATMDDLIWSVGPHQDDPGARQRLPELLPGLLQALRDGLASAALDSFASSEYFGQLEQLHAAAISNLNRELQAQPLMVVEKPKELLRHEQARVPVERPSAAVQPVQPVESVEVVEQIVLSAPGESRQTVPEVLLAEDDEALRKVDALRVGSWFELQEADHKQRCKLAAVIKQSGNYIFVNRSGVKVLEKTRTGLALELRRGTLHMLDDALLFDRALESVIGNLRRLKGN